jgi:adenosylhomocysteine nucleosidase
MEQSDPPLTTASSGQQGHETSLNVKPDELACDILLFVATQSEREQLEVGAKELGLPFEEKLDERVGTYFTLGTIGSARVRAIRTRMGPFFHQGSASQAIILRAATSATSIIQIGMAFGIQRGPQDYGEVLVSEWVFPYDYRIVEQDGTGYRVDYSETKPFRAKDALVKLFRREYSAKRHPFTVHFGGFLSGGSRIRSQSYLKQLLAQVTGTEGPEGYVGGEMEGVGLLSSCEKKNPIWAVVKGICDFADDKQGEDAATQRTQACLNAVRFVLSALRHADEAHVKV